MKIMMKLSHFVFCTVTMQVWKCTSSTAQNECTKYVTMYTDNQGSVTVPQHESSKITASAKGKNTIPKPVGNTKFKSMKLYTLQLAVVVLNTIVSRRVSNSVAFVSLA